MRKSGRGLTPEEKQLWRGVTVRVRPRRRLAEDAPPEPMPPPKAAPKPRPPTAPAARAAPEAPPQDRGAEKRVRRGKLEVAASLDLHGQTRAGARTAVRRFLRAPYARGDRTVVIVTGIGRAGEGVLKRSFPGWIAESDLRPIVSGFAQAHRAHGGAGAFYVFLKRPASACA